MTRDGADVGSSLSWALVFVLEVLSSVSLLELRVPRHLWRVRVLRDKIRNPMNLFRIDWREI